MASAAVGTQLNDYAALMIFTSVGYDYILTFSDEVEYIWKKPWTRVSILYVLGRYFGLCAVVILALCSPLLYICAMAILIFIGAADLVMIFRVWALYNRSRFILGLLLTIYTAEMIICIIDCAILGKIKPIAMARFSSCEIQYTSSYGSEVAMFSVQIALCTLLCLLVAIRFIRESLQMYRVTKQLQLSQYVNILASDGLFYFLAILSYSLIGALLIYAPPISSIEWWDVLAGAIQIVPAFTLTPRLILSLRKLYARALQGRRATEVDTGFGLTPSSGQTVVTSVIVFADRGEIDAEERDGEHYEEFEMKERHVSVGGDGGGRG